MFKRLWRKYGPNLLDKQLKAASLSGKKKILIPWNRGLGDIALGLYGLTHRIREFIPDAEITFVTRSDLQAGFALLENVRVLMAPEWKRGKPFDIAQTLQQMNIDRNAFDLIITNPDPSRFLAWQRGRLIPRLQWKKEWDELHRRFSLQPGKFYVGVHVQTETNYAYEKNWPLESWQQLFQWLRKEKAAEIILFGFAKSPSFATDGIVDLRGETSLFEMLSIIKNRCSLLVVPDSGVLSLTYYISASFPLKVVSLWADPNQGVLKQSVPSPNPELVHIPLLGPDGKVSQISLQTVINALSS
jgi:ADP-heptose:LPS heptosyltransferase